MPDPQLLPDTKRREDPIQDVVSSRRAGDRIDRSQRSVKIQQQHFVRNANAHHEIFLFTINNKFTKQHFETQAHEKTDIILEDALANNPTTPISA